MELKGKNVTVIGCARSGIGAAKILNALGAVVTITDQKNRAALAEEIAMVPQAVHLALGGHPAELFEKADLVVVSPGVPLESAAVEMAKTSGIPVIGELELAYRMVEATAERPGVPILAVTGSNGKSTTTSLLNQMMITAGRRTLLGGNIGNALTEELSARIDPQTMGWQSLPPDWIVAEVSSFQLEAIERFRPRGAAILNITPDHLDRYHALEDYARAKLNIAAKQTPDDFIVLNADDPETARIGKALEHAGGGPRVFYFSRTRPVRGVFSRDGRVHASLGPSVPLADGQIIANAGEIRIRGVHNLENAMAAMAMALLAECPLDAAQQALRDFGGLEHRLELVRELDGVRYYNDSKGTNVGAVMKSLEGFTEPVILIAGGRDKAGDFRALRDLVAERVKAVVLIGEAAEKIRAALSDVTRTVPAHDLPEAVKRARELAAHGDVVLLSPACASFDMFRDFEDRGRQFKKIVEQLGRRNAAVDA